jgi:hypothetical protein
MCPTTPLYTQRVDGLDGLVVALFANQWGDHSRPFGLREFVIQDDKVVALTQYAWHVQLTGRD